MTAHEFKAILDTLDFNNKEASIFLGITERSVYNYLNGKTIPLYIEKFILLAIKVRKLENSLYLLSKQELISGCLATKPTN